MIEGGSKKRQRLLGNRIRITDVEGGVEGRDSERDSDFRVEGHKYWFGQIEFQVPAGHLHRTGKEIAIIILHSPQCLLYITCLQKNPVCLASF